MDWQMHGYTLIYADAMRGTICPDTIYTRTWLYIAQSQTQSMLENAWI